MVMTKEMVSSVGLEGFSDWGAVPLHWVCWNRSQFIEGGL